MTLKSKKAKINASNTAEQCGFTIIEIIVVLGILSMLLILSIAISFQHYKSFALHAERDRVVGILTQSRTLAMVNSNRLPHGVHVTSDSFIIFQGQEFITTDPQNTIISSDTAVGHNGISDIIFTQVSGNVLQTGTISLNNASGSEDISINTEGLIQW